MPDRKKRGEAPQHVMNMRKAREVSKAAVRQAEREVWRRNGGGLPAVKGKGESRRMTPAEYERAFGRPMPTELQASSP